MQHCAAHVQVMIVCTSAVKDQDRNDVHDQSGRSDNRHDGAEHFDQVQSPMNCIIDDPGGDEP